MQKSWETGSLEEPEGTPRDYHSMEVESHEHCTSLHSAVIILEGCEELLEGLQRVVSKTFDRHSQLFC